MIPLVQNTITHEEIDALADWLRTHPRLTKGDLCLEFENKWSEFLGCKYSVFVNSGSSANLIILQSLLETGKLKKGDKVIVPSVSWATDVAPVVQLGLEPVLCDCNLTNLSVELNMLQDLITKHNPKALILVSVLGLVPNMPAVVEICEKYNVLLLEDACESFGSKYNGKNLGTFGFMSSFSTFFGHHLSTIEGGMVCTDDVDMYNMLKCVRSHGWGRDLDKPYHDNLKKNIDPFQSLYTFYHMGFNVRATDLQAFLGINQIKKAKEVVRIRNDNYNLYNSMTQDLEWVSQPSNNTTYVSNFAYPVIHRNRNKVVEKLLQAEVQTRPLICGSIGRQPFWVKRFGESRHTNADFVHDYGLYLPNNGDITKDEIKFICSLITKGEEK